MDAIRTFLTDGMILHPDYPASIQIPHALASAYDFRRSYSIQEWANVSFWHKLLGAYFCNGYGGSTVRDLFLGQPPSLVSHPTVPYFWMVNMALMNYSPGDIVYKMASTPHHPFRLAMLFGEAVDSATTVCSAFEKGARLHPSSTLAPYIAALIACLGGSIARYFERRGRGQVPKAETSEPTGSIERSSGYILIYALLRRRFGVPVARFSLTMFHVLMTLFNDISCNNYNPVGAAMRLIGLQLVSLKSSLHLGPPNTLKQL